MVSKCSSDTSTFEIDLDLRWYLLESKVEVHTYIVHDRTFVISLLILKIYSQDRTDIKGVTTLYEQSSRIAIYIAYVTF